VKEYLMKKLLLMSAVLALAACGEKKAAEAPAGETTGEMAPAADTGMAGMSHDSAMTSDSTMTRDSAK
jgi:predicted small lipoprotein YifL